MTPGRPPLDRDPLYAAILGLTPVGRGLRYVSARSLAVQLGHHRNTLNQMIQDLEAAGRILVVRSKGKHGMLVKITDPSYQGGSRRSMTTKVAMPNSVHDSF